MQKKWVIKPFTDAFKLVNCYKSLSYHTKVTFCPERVIEKARLDANRDLRMTVERLAVNQGPQAVLHNLRYSKLFAEEFQQHHGKYCRYD